MDYLFHNKDDIFYRKVIDGQPFLIKFIDKQYLQRKVINIWTFLNKLSWKTFSIEW